MTARARKKLETEAKELARRLSNAEPDLLRARDELHEARITFRLAEDSERCAWGLVSNLTLRLKYCREKLEEE